MAIDRKYGRGCPVCRYDRSPVIYLRNWIKAKGMDQDRLLATIFPKRECPGDDPPQG